MKLLYRFIAVLVGLYIVCIGALVLVLYNLERLHEPIESAISKYLGQTVTIAEMDSAWSGSHLVFFAGNNVVQDGQDNTVHYAKITHVAAQLDVKSLFYFWPKFTQISIEQPQITVESFADGSFRFAGKRYKPSQDRQVRSTRVFDWLFSQKSADVHAGEILWKHREGKETKVENLSARYRLENEQRVFYAVGQHDTHALGVSALLSGDFIWEDQWDAQAAFWSGSEVQNIENLNAKLSVKQGQGALKIEKFKVQRLIDIVNIFGQGSAAQQWLAESELSGELNDIVLNFKGSVSSLRQWQFQAMASQLTWQASSDLPGLSSIDAEIVVDQQQGQLSFSSENSILQWPQQLKQTVEINEFSGTLSLFHQSDDLKLKFNDGRIITPIIQVEGINGILQKDESRDIYLDLQSQLKTSDLQNVEQYFPSLINEQFRNWWNNAMPEKQFVSGEMSYQGTVNHEDFFSGKSQLKASLDTQNASLDFGFQQDWPVFTADKLHIDWQNDTLVFFGEKPKVGNIDITNPKVKLRRLFHRDRLLSMQGQISGELQEIVDFLQDGPLISPEAKQLRSPNRVDVNSVTGHFSSEIDISLPLNKVRDVSLQGQGDIINGALLVGDFLPVKNIQGKVSYTEKDVTAQNIKGEVFDGTAKVDVKTLVPGKQLKVRLDIEGEVGIAAMQQLISPQLASRFRGESSWIGFVEIDSLGVNIAMESDLLGTNLAFPQPYGKTETEIEKVSVKFQAGRDQELQLQVQAEQFDLQFESIDSQNLLDRGLIIAGGESAQKFVRANNKQANGLPTEGLNIFATGIDVDIDEWLNNIQEMTAVPSDSQGNKPFNERLKKLHVEPRNLTIFGKNLGATNFIANSVDGLAWEVDIDGQYAKGIGKMTPFADVPAYDFTFDRLHWPSAKELLVRGIVVPESQEDSDVAKPNTYPKVDLLARNVRVFDKDFSQLSFKAIPDETAWQFKEIVLSASGVDIKATGKWFDDGSRNGMTTVDATAAAKVGGQVLTGFGFGGFLENGEFTFNSTISWRGAPAHFSFDRLKGNYALDVLKGSFPKVDAESGRFFGLLNVNALSRRLRLDFGDVFGRGLVFDRLKTQGIFNEGNIVLRDFYILSPSVYVEAQGKVGLDSEDYDLRMLVSPQLGGNVALLTALSNPAAGAVVWLADRIFKNQLNKVIVYTYDIVGPWTEPTITRVIRNDLDEEFPEFSE